jgi:hypothetical protein
MQVGRDSPAFDGGCFSPALETTVQRFQQFIAEAVVQPGVPVANAEAADCASSDCQSLDGQD